MKKDTVVGRASFHPYSNGIVTPNPLFTERPIKPEVEPSDIVFQIGESYIKITNRHIIIHAPEVVLEGNVKLD